jgi:nucleoside-diphosphate-sugar epimerase
VAGLDSGLFDGCDYGDTLVEVPWVRRDIRDVTEADFDGFDAVIHLAALSNDPLGDLDPDITFDINHRGSVRAATMAKRAGVERFLHSSTCSLYGAHGDDYIDETAEFHPVTPYGSAKVLAERDISALADDAFSPVFLRNATAFGFSCRLRGDLVVNNLTAYAVATGAVMMKSQGMAWRPLVHIDDIAKAFIVLLEAERSRVHLQALNVGRTSENYRVREIAEMVGEAVPGSEVTFADGAFVDTRNYRVNCDRILELFPEYEPTWTVRDGIKQLFEAYTAHGMTADLLHSGVLTRIAHVRGMQESGRLQGDLRWAPIDLRERAEVVA